MDNTEDRGSKKSEWDQFYRIFSLVTKNNYITQPNKFAYNKQQAKLKYLA